MQSWTPFADLDAVLSQWLSAVVEILDQTLLGAYLVGSFGAGHGDEYSDVDFLAVTAKAMTRQQLSSLGDMHEHFSDLPGPWAQHLEGSYPTVDQVRVLDESHSPWLYLDNGSSWLELSGHDNTAVLRWSILHRCVVLAGAQPQTLVQPISAEVLRAETRQTLPGFVTEVLSWPGLDDAWAQPHTVITLCRKLATLAQGRVFGKAEALNWAIEVLDPRWAELLRHAKQDRPDPWLRVGQPTRVGSVEATRRFAVACLNIALAIETT